MRKLDRLLERKVTEEASAIKSRLLESRKIRDEFQQLMLNENQRTKIVGNRLIGKNIDRFFDMDKTSKSYAGYFHDYFASNA